MDDKETFLSGWPTPPRLDKNTDNLDLSTDELTKIGEYADLFYDRSVDTIAWSNLCEQIAYNVKFHRKFAGTKTNVEEYLSKLKKP